MALTLRTIGSWPQFAGLSLHRCRLFALPESQYAPVAWPVETGDAARPALSTPFPTGVSYCVATLPEARRQGLGTALTLAPLRDARALGYRFATLQASKMGVGVYRRLGFWEQFKVGMYAWSPEQAASGTGQ